MAQVKLLLPGFTYASGLFGFAAAPSALLSLVWLQDGPQDVPDTREKIEIPTKNGGNWKQAESKIKATNFLEKESVKSLSFAMEDDNDYEEG